MNLHLDWCSHEAAKYAVENWHYSRTMPAGKLAKIGVWENNSYIGCVLFGYGATPNLCKAYGLRQNQLVELTRVALTKHKHPVSKIVAVAVKMLKRRNPGLRIIVSFADMGEDHYGVIYQAGNWIYSGAVNLDVWIINGEKIHPRSVVAKYETQAKSYIATIDPTAKKTWGTKHRYLMALDDEMRKQIELLRQPYPKRPKQATSNSN